MSWNLFLLLSVLCTTSALIPPTSVLPGNHAGTCKNLTDLTPSRILDTEKLQGIWYLKGVYVDPNSDNLTQVTFEPQGCLTINMIKIFPSQGPNISAEICVNFENGGMTCFTEYASIDESILPLQSAWYGLEIEDFTPMEPYAPIIWLQTDHENWALTYLCLYIKYFGSEVKAEMMLLLGRQPKFVNDEVLNVLHAVIENYGFSKESVIPIDFTHCDEMK